MVIVAVSRSMQHHGHPIVVVLAAVLLLVVVVVPTTSAFSTFLVAALVVLVPGAFTKNPSKTPKLLMGVLVVLLVLMTV